MSMSDDEVNWNLVINENGKLMTKGSKSLKYKEVVGVCPTFNLSDKDQHYDFLCEIAKENYCSAITFTFKY